MVKSLPVVEVAKVTAPLLVVAKPVPIAVSVPIPPTQVPLTEKQPVVTLMPLLKVEVAPPCCVSAPVFDIAKSVVVADAVDEPIAKSVVFVSPLFAWSESFANGEVVPRPKLPVAVRRACSPRVEPLRVKKVRAEVVETPSFAVNIEAIREVAVCRPYVVGLEKRRPLPIPAATTFAVDEATL